MRKTEKLYWIFFSSNIVSHQKPPSISEDIFFFLKNLRIACWSCVQKSNHRTRKSDFYCWNQSSSRLIFWVSMVSINFQNPNWLISITHHRHSQLKISKSSFEMCLIVQKVQEFFCTDLRGDDLRRFFSWEESKVDYSYLSLKASLSKSSAIFVSKIDAQLGFQPITRSAQHVQHSRSSDWLLLSIHTGFEIPFFLWKRYRVLH